MEAGDGPNRESALYAVPTADKPSMEVGPRVRGAYGLTCTPEWSGKDQDRLFL